MFVRYTVFGLVSAVLFLVSLSRHKSALGQLWKKSFFAAALGCALPYFFILLSIKLTGAPVALAIQALLPVTCSVYAGFRMHINPFKVMLFPLLSVLFGIAFVNYAGISLPDSKWNIWGILLSAVALVMYTKYYVYNAEVLKTHEDLPVSTWTQLTGISNTAMLPPLIAVVFVLLPDSVDFNHFFGAGTLTLQLWAAGLVLGIVVSYITIKIWNTASKLLPTSIVSQLVILEIVFGLLYSYLIVGKAPIWTEIVGIVLIFIGTAWAIHKNNVLLQKSAPDTGTIAKP